MGEARYIPDLLGLFLATTELFLSSYAGEWRYL